MMIITVVMMLAGGARALCNFNHVDKLEPTSFAVWMAVLRSYPEAVLRLLSPQEPLAGPAMRQLRHEAASYGVHPSRLDFLPRVAKDEHLTRLALPGTCDLFLDTFVYGAHTTASDALWAGVPLITTEGWGGDGDLLGRFQVRLVEVSGGAH
jgi:protein O-GlcNAc transferase